jgi:hypothetical protein
MVTEEEEEEVERTDSVSDEDSGSGRSRRRRQKSSSSSVRCRRSDDSSKKARRFSPYVLPAEKPQPQREMEHVRMITSLNVEKDRNIFAKKAVRGPAWSVFLIINAMSHQESRVHTIVGVTDYAIDEVEFIFNDRQRNPYRSTHDHVGYWVMLLAVSGFDAWQTAREFFTNWCRKCRGIISRATKGVALYKHYKQRHAQDNLRIHSVGALRREKLLQI